MVKEAYERGQQIYDRRYDLNMKLVQDGEFGGAKCSDIRDVRD